MSRILFGQKFQKTAILRPTATYSLHTYYLLEVARSLRPDGRVVVLVIEVLVGKWGTQCLIWQRLQCIHCKNLIVCILLKVFMWNINWCLITLAFRGRFSLIYIFLRDLYMKLSWWYKVHIFWEGHKNLRNLHLTFDWHCMGQK